ncbi:MAG: tRNA glutamyl-Q(34) synthetase GluQRS [Planctomycetes bacterium]|jgi:glutamyl-tRNA synthetase|nr:tRNA glutamyl-Q(34) synthetase GluQRS [Planctomycetota bacterium]MCL4729801.1 tRNA glutamyl-Q(34) synthetase GluQRS [Planctomycetota bacterium]
MPPTAPTGRLAPTPSGLLHLGNARSFLLAWLWARAVGGRVVLRIEDIDRPRCKSEYRRQAVEDLQWLGLDWDETAPDQSTRTEAYRTALQTLMRKGLAYPCTCTRKDIEEASSAPHGDDGAIYPGTCRGKWRDAAHARQSTGREPAWRFLWQDPPVTFRDEIAGEVTVDPSTLGDFVLWRRDDLPSYQLAVAVDDAAQGVTQVLRGRDLLLSTARQLALYAALGLAAPAQWAHVPFIQDAQGRRMSKREGDISLKALRERGVDPRKLVGFLAWTAGLADAGLSRFPADLASGFRPARLAGTDFMLSDQQLAGLAG